MGARFDRSVAYSGLRDINSGWSASARTNGSRSLLVCKRSFDLATAVASFPFVFLVCIVVAILNPFLNPGPLFFVQTRIGRNCAPFRIMKLRTMVGPAGAARFADAESSRITRFGAFLRRRRIDELPQFFNVLLGQMSVIGPRPEQPEFFAQFASTIPGYAARQAVRPGITGLAQVYSGYACDRKSTRQKLRFDLYYVRSMSPMMELHIVQRTVWIILTGFGAR